MDDPFGVALPDRHVQCPERQLGAEIDELSTGQKATAVPLLLLESDTPLIVAQPEDDIDNRFITEGVVPHMRAEKQRRQFVFSTHNANFPVLGDAELIVGLTASGEADRGHARIVPECVGSIDDRQVRELVEELLRRRQRRLRAAPPEVRVLIGYKRLRDSMK